MADAIVFKSVKKDPTKANPRKLEDYTVKFPENLKDYEGRVTVKFKHADAQILSQCHETDSEGNVGLSNFEIFRRCVKEIHGLQHMVVDKDGNEEYVEMTPSDVIHYEGILDKTEEGESGMLIIFTIVHDVAQAILMKSVLTEEEEKN